MLVCIPSNMFTYYVLFSVSVITSYICLYPSICIFIVGRAVCKCHYNFLCMHVCAYIFVFICKVGHICECVSMHIFICICAHVSKYVGNLVHMGKKEYVC